MPIASASAPESVSVSLDRLEVDSLAVWRDLRKDHPVAYLPSLGLVAITRHQDVERVCREAATFSAETPEGPLSRTLGLNFMHADGDNHLLVRQHLVPAMRVRELREAHGDWLRAKAREIVGGLAQGPAFDVMSQLAHPLSTGLISRITGVRATDEDFEKWFRALAAGVGNFEGDSDKDEEAELASREIEAAVTAATSHEGIVAALLDAGFSRSQVVSTVKLFVIGGIQEPRDLLGFAVWGLIESGAWNAGCPATDLPSAIEEATRWGSPVGTVTRTVTKDTEISGVLLSAGTRVAAVVASANHDADRWTTPEVFMPGRREGAHLSYGTGPHTCIGAAASRLLVRVAIDELMRQWPQVSLVEAPERIGYEFSGPAKVLIAARGA